MFDSLTFKKPVKKERVLECSIRLMEKDGSIRLHINTGAIRVLDKIAQGYNSIELLVSEDNVFGIKPKIKLKSKNQTVFTVTGLRGNIDKIPLNKKLRVIEYDGMIVCDLRKKS